MINWRLVVWVIGLLQPSPYSSGTFVYLLSQSQSAGPRGMCVHPDGLVSLLVES